MVHVDTFYINQEEFMRVINFTEARNYLKSVLDQVVNDVEYTVISRRDAAFTF